MMKDVIINITGMQDPGDQQDAVEMTTVGRLGIRNGSMLLSYEESQLIGMSGIKTSLYITGEDTVILRRTGEIASRLVICRGKRNNCLYRTVQGDIMLGIYGEQIENRLSEAGGELTIRYTLDTNLQFLSRNEVKITVREVETNVNTSS